MTRGKRHWTETSMPDFVFRIGADFVYQIECKLDSQKELAHKLGITEGAVSQTLNSPGNLKLQTMIQYARALGMKLSVLVYDDGDAENNHGPIHADIFKVCWEKAGRPSDFAALGMSQPMQVAITSEGCLKEEDGRYEYTGAAMRMTINVQGTITLPSCSDFAMSTQVGAHSAMSELGG